MVTTTHNDLVYHVCGVERSLTVDSLMPEDGHQSWNSRKAKKKETEKPTAANAAAAAAAEDGELPSPSEQGVAGTEKSQPKTPDTAKEGKKDVDGKPAKKKRPEIVGPCTFRDYFRWVLGEILGLLICH